MASPLSGELIDQSGTSLRILANIDGTDQLHISHRAARWVHGSWGWPAHVEINGQSWTPRQQPALQVGPDSPFLRSHIRLAGATIRKLRGRGQVNLAYGANGLIVRFDDEGHNGSATYEVLITFADQICEQSRREIESLKSESGQPLQPIELNIQTKIDGADAIQIDSDKVKWAHYESSWPRKVSLNDRNWDPYTEREFKPESKGFFIPAGLNLSGAELVEKKGRGAVQLLKSDDRLTIRFDDRHAPGADNYAARIRIPISQLWPVVIQCDLPEHVVNAPLTILRYEKNEKRPTIVTEQHVFDHLGRTIVALPAGSYQFEVQHQPRPDVLVALKSSRVEVGSATTVRLQSIQIPTPKLVVSGHRGLDLTQLGIRSILPTGAVAWKRNSRANHVSLVLSQDQTYRIRVFGSNNYAQVALWKELKTNEIRRIRETEENMVRCSFGWQSESLPPLAAGVELDFPDSHCEFRVTNNTLFLTNRRFLELGYWFQLKNGRKVVFHPRGYALPKGESDHQFELGGPLTGRASAAILTNENLGSPHARQLWTDICLVDPHGHILDHQKSTIDWKWEVQMRDGAAPPKPPLTPEAVMRLGNVAETVVLKARYQLDQPVELTLPPERFVSRRSKRVSTTSPPYMNWRTAAYLAKAERSLSEIASEREIPLNPSYRVKLTWWLNGGAVGGHGGTTMPLRGMTGDFNWFKHPWAISHELLHGFGYGHDDDMNRTDRVVQRRFLEHKWFVADHPDHAPELLIEPKAMPTKFVYGEPVDLLKLIDLERDTLLGEWKWEDDVLLTPVSSGGRLKLPVEAPSSYELLMVVTRLKGRDTLGIDIIVGEDDIGTMLALDGWLGQACGLHYLDGRGGDQNESTYKRGVFPDQKEHTILCRVTPESVFVEVDDNRIIDWHGDPKRFRISSDSAATRGRELFLAETKNVSYRISKIQLRTIKSPE
ncbi:hypothetical protein [Gimesia algae]|uniref:Uncharacterized protein n=1 Tax=Gimesia algae TaxID=2527971 RepID=A0A517VGQ4_9PLAN|nr:hypothetical protein [Gimesia algae]QDT92193.1 hypothetical protein Pan161_38600 [Gimesia algae]